MSVQLRNSLNEEDEYHAFKRLFLTFGIQKKNVVNSGLRLLGKSSMHDTVNYR